MPTPISRYSHPSLLEPGLNALFGAEYARYDNEHTIIYQTVKSDRAFEEEVLLTGFGAARELAEGEGVTYDTALEGWTARYVHKQYALAFAITKMAVEDNLYEQTATRLTKALARSMAHTKQVEAVYPINNAFNASVVGGDGVALCSTAHPLVSGGTFANRPTTDSDLSETSVENAIIDIANWVDDRGLPVVVQPRKLLIPRQSMFIAEKLFSPKAVLQTDTANNTINAVVSMNVLPGGVHVIQRFTDPDAWFILTDCSDGLKHFERVSMETGMEGDWETDNMRYKARERYSFGYSDPRCIYGVAGG